MKFIIGFIRTLLLIPSVFITNFVIWILWFFTFGRLFNINNVIITLNSFLIKLIYRNK